MVICMRNFHLWLHVHAYTDPKPHQSNWSSCFHTVHEYFTSRLHRACWDFVGFCAGWAGPLDLTHGMDQWTGPVHWDTGLGHWTVPMGWATGLDQCTGPLDCSTGLCHCIGPLDCTTGMDKWTWPLDLATGRGHRTGPLEPLGAGMMTFMKDGAF